MGSKRKLINDLDKQINEVREIIYNRFKDYDVEYTNDFYNILEYERLMNENNFDQDDRDNYQFDMGKLYGLKEAYDKLNKNILDFKTKIRQKEKDIQLLFDFIVEISGDSKENILKYKNLQNVLKKNKHLI